MKIERYEQEYENDWALGLIVHDEGAVIALGVWVYSISWKPTPPPPAREK